MKLIKYFGLHFFIFFIAVQVSAQVTPSIQATSIDVTSLHNSQFSISWTNGDGSSRAVFVKHTNIGTAAPVDNTTYTANTSFGSGSEIDATGWYCVYNGTGTNVTVTNLSAGEIYRVMVTEYNGTSGSERYNITSSTGNPLTIYSIPSHTAIAPSAGNGTSGDPYLISTLENLYWIASSSDNWIHHYKQTQNIDASATSGWSYGGWTPIGNNSLGFSGTYNGNGHSITGLFINRDQPQQGLFGNTNGANISLLILLSVNITNSGSERFTGGLIGQAFNSTITNCSSSGSATGNSYVGILVGDNNSGSLIQNCFGTGSVSTSGFFSGGFVGRCLNATITNCYSKTNITRTSGNNAGIAAFIGNISGSTVTKCYSTGSFSFTSGSAATNRGFVGGDGGSNTFQDNFFDLGTSGQLTGTGAIGKTTTEMKTLSTFTSAGWDFSGETINGSNDFWQIDGVNNNGYPYLSWQFTPFTQASNIVFSNVLNHQFNVSWTNGNGTKRAVFVKLTNMGTAAPADGSTYTANTSYGSGTQIGATGWYCVYNGTGSNVTVTNLLNGTEYRVMVTEYNGIPGSELYNTNSATDNPLNQTTSNLSPTVITSAATNVGLSSATLNGEVNPNSSATDAYFEWGTDNTLTIFNTTSSLSIGSGTSNVPVTDDLTGLTSSTTYYFRIVGSSSVGLVKGSILSFTTSTPGLSTWVPFETNFIYSLFDISFVDGDAATGFAVGEQGAILKTTNNGTNWQVIHNVPGKWFNSVHMISSSVAYAVGTFGLIQKTTDGGTTWIDQSVTGTDKHFRSVYAVSSTEAYAVGYAGTFYSTTDGGVTSWIQNTQIPWTMHSIAMAPDFSSSGKGIIAATDGKVYRRSSTGTWIFINLPSTLGVYDYLNSVVWLGNSNAVIIGNNGRILKSTNSGASWSIKTSPTTQHLRDVDAVSFGAGEFVLIAVGDAGTIIRSHGFSSTAGNTWTLETSGTTRHLYGVSLPTINYGFTVGEISGGSTAASFMNNNLSISTTSASPISTNFVPNEYELLQNFPNPFNPTTTIRFGLPEATSVKLNIYDMTGRLIQQLVNQNLNAGYYEFSFDASPYASGTYFYRLESKDFVVTKKMLLIK